MSNIIVLGAGMVGSAMAIDLVNLTDFEFMWSACQKTKRWLSQ